MGQKESENLNVQFEVDLINWLRNAFARSEQKQKETNICKTTITNGVEWVQNIHSNKTKEKIKLEKKIRSHSVFGENEHEM